MSTITVTIDINGELHTRQSIRQPHLTTEEAEKLGDRVNRAVSTALRPAAGTRRGGPQDLLPPDQIHYDINRKATR